MTYKHCICCKQQFSPLNVFTDLGEVETQISGLCEECFDGMLDYEYEEDDEEEF